MITFPPPPHGYKKLTSVKATKKHLKSQMRDDMIKEYANVIWVRKRKSFRTTNCMGSISTTFTVYVNKHLKL